MTNTPVARFSLRKQTVFLFVLLSVVSVIALGDYYVRLANAWGDGTPVAYARYGQDPAHWDGDFFTSTAKWRLYSSIDSWLPLALQAKIGLPVEMTVYVQSFLQIFLLGFSIWKLTHFATRKSSVAWMAVFFCLAANPVSWNLALHYSAQRLPADSSSTWLALPILILAITELIMNRTWPFRLLMLLGGLTQPALALYCVLAACLYYSCLYFSDKKLLLLHLVYLAGITAFFSLPMLVFSASMDNFKIETADFMALFFVNGHIMPWNYPAYWNPALSLFFWYTLLAFISINNTRLSSHYILFTWSLCIACSVFALSQIIGLTVEWPFLVSLNGMRSTMLAIAWFLPAISMLLFKKLFGDRLIPCGAAVLIILLPIITTTQNSSFWGGVLVLIVDECAHGRFGPWKIPPREKLINVLSWLSRLLFVAWLVYLAYTMRNQSPLLLGYYFPGFQGTPHDFAILLLSAGVIVGCSYMAKRISSFWILCACFRGVMIVGIILAMLYWAIKTGEPTYSQRSRDLYLAQIWAKDNTPRKGRFIAYGIPWRTFSLRQTVNPGVSLSWIYTKDLAEKQFSDDIVVFYGIDKLWHTAQPDWIAYITAESKAYFSLDIQKISALAEKYNANYVVRQLDKPLALPTIYSNDSFAIYTITNN